jgi:signal peptidase I
MRSHFSFAKELRLNPIIAILFAMGLVVIGIIIAPLLFSPKLSLSDELCATHGCIIKSVSGPSMSPLIRDGDSIRVVLDYYDRNPLQRGDVVLIDFNVDQFLRVKRLVGLPGDEIEIDANGDLRVNGQMVLHHLPDFPFVESQFIFFNSAVLTNEGKFIPENRTLVLSDNPLHAADSRTWGFVSPDLFVGKVVEVIPAPE